MNKKPQENIITVFNVVEKLKRWERRCYREMHKNLKKNDASTLSVDEHFDVINKISFYRGGQQTCKEILKEIVNETRKDGKANVRARNPLRPMYKCMIDTEDKP